MLTQAPHPTHITDITLTLAVVVVPRLPVVRVVVVALPVLAVVVQGLGLGFRLWLGQSQAAEAEHQEADLYLGLTRRQSESHE